MAIMMMHHLLPFGTAGNLMIDCTYLMCVNLINLHKNFRLGDWTKLPNKIRSELDEQKK
jgi:hypothetical protein